MKIWTKLMIPAVVAALSGCVMVPVGPRGYGPRMAVVAPAPIVVVRPAYYGRYRW